MNIVDPIIPGVGLGGFIINQSISSYFGLTQSSCNLDKLIVSDINNNSVMYQLKSFPLEVYVDKRTDRIYMISATTGYKGKLLNSISVGMKIIDIYKKHPDFYYYECEEVILSKEIDGFCLDIGGGDPLPQEVPELCIQAISVFNPEVFKPNYMVNV